MVEVPSVWRWLLMGIGLFVVSVGGQAFAPGPISERCAPRSALARYQGGHLEWRWLPVTGQYCVWRDTATGREASAWAMGRLPEEHLKSHRGPPGNCAALEPEGDDDVACYYVDEDGNVVQEGP